MDAELHLLPQILLCAGVGAYLFMRHWRDEAGVGLLFTYILTFGLLHWLAPALFLLPWYDVPGLDLTVEGLGESTLAMVAFAVGAELAAWLERRHRSAEPAEWLAVVVNQRSTFYLVVGTVLYVLVTSVLQRLPSITAIAATGSTLVVAGLGLRCWTAWQEGRKGRLWLWVIATAPLPIVTVVAQGFLGFGFAGMLTVLGLVASFYRPRWQVLLAGVLLTYLGLSVYVTYMRDRGDIRNVVWSGAGFDARFQQLGDTFREGEWFDLSNSDHLDRINQRLNQDFLIGAAVSHLQADPRAFAHGATLAEAVVALVPRALWPNKPVAAGSGNLVTTYTGIVFAEGTSVGVGQVMESYINFGTPGVVVGFFLIGLIVVTVDRRAAWQLRQGDVDQFLLWYLPGLSLLQIGGSFVELTSTAGAGLVMALLLRQLMRLRAHAQPLHVRLQSGRPGRSGVSP